MTNLHLIDGSAFIHRAYHALPPLTRKTDGHPIGAVAGFSKMLYRYILRQRSADPAMTHIAVVWDFPARTFRSEIHPEYKANRPPKPDDLRSQLPLARAAAAAFSVAQVEARGFEADDVIATLARQVGEAGGFVTIVSSDKDLMQLIGPRVVMWDPMKRETIGSVAVFKKFGVRPSRVVDVQALAGDSVDNVPGAPGIGIKIAAELINKFGDLDTLLARVDEVPQPKRRENLTECRNVIRVSRDLVKLRDDVPLECAINDLAAREIDVEKLRGWLASMELWSLYDTVAADFGAQAYAPPIARRAGERPSPLMALTRWHRAAMRGENPPRHDGTPQCGWYRMRMVKGGPWVPVSIYVTQEIDENGVLASDELLSASAFGESVDPRRVWSHLAPISKADFDRLTQYRLENQHRFFNDRPIDMKAAPTLPGGIS